MTSSKYFCKWYKLLISIEPALVRHQLQKLSSASHPSGLTCVSTHTEHFTSQSLTPELQVKHTKNEVQSKWRDCHHSSQVLPVWENETSVYGVLEVSSNSPIKDYLLFQKLFTGLMQRSGLRGHKKILFLQWLQVLKGTVHIVQDSITLLLKARQVIPHLSRKRELTDNRSKISLSVFVSPAACGDTATTFPSLGVKGHLPHARARNKQMFRDPQK